MTEANAGGRAVEFGGAGAVQVNAHADLAPSRWVTRFAHLIKPGGKVLDLACGSGRHARYLARLGFQVEAVDRDLASLSALAGVSGVATCEADLEGAPWPYAPACFDGVVVTNYLHRPLFSDLLAALRPGGVLIYETFAVGNELHGRPSKAEFLLRSHELLHWVLPALQVLAFEQGLIDQPKPAVVQRICALARGIEHCSLTAREGQA